MQNPEETDKGSIEKSQRQAPTARPGPGDPWNHRCRRDPRGLALGLRPGVQIPGCHPQDGTGREELSGGCFTTLSLWFPSLSQMQIMRLNSGGSCVLRAGRGEGARSHRGLVSHGGHKGNRSPLSHTCRQDGRRAGRLHLPSWGARALPSCRLAPGRPGLLWAETAGPQVQSGYSLTAVPRLPATEGAVLYVTPLSPRTREDPVCQKPYL